MSKPYTLLFQVESDHDMGGDRMFPTIAEAREYATELVADGQSQATVTEISVRSQPSKAEVCRIYNRERYCEEFHVKYTVEPTDPYVIRYRNNKENNNGN